MTPKEATHITHIMQTMRGFFLAAITSETTPYVAACCLVADAEGRELEEVADSVKDQECDIALILLADRFVTNAKKRHGHDDFDAIIRLEVEKECASIN